MKALDFQIETLKLRLPSSEGAARSRVKLQPAGRLPLTSPAGSTCSAMNNKIASL